MSSQVENVNVASLHRDTHIGFVELTVADMERSVQFYEEVLGFKVIKRAESRTTLGANNELPLLGLVEQNNASPKPHYTTGLYHFAILVPSRVDLARSLLRLAEMRYPLGGSSDHLVSEALYLSDPDDNGIEIYRDRPRGDWPRHNGQIQMATDPLDITGIVEEARHDSRPWQGLDPQTYIGHIHLQVANLKVAEDFYSGVLGFNVMLRAPGALFISAGGYHHHIGLNTWNSRGAPQPPSNSAGLRLFTISLPDEAEQGRVLTRIQAAGLAFEQHQGVVVLHDPWNNGIFLTVGSAFRDDEAQATTSH